MAFDGDLEAMAVLAALGAGTPLVGGRIYEGLIDSLGLSMEADGDARPFLNVDFGEPVPDVDGRGLGDETTQPYTFFFTITASAATAKAARATMRAASKRLIGVKITPNSGQVRSAFSRNHTIVATTNRPSRFLRTRHFECSINAQPNS